MIDETNPRLRRVLLSCACSSSAFRNAKRAKLFRARVTRSLDRNVVIAALRRSPIQREPLLVNCVGSPSRRRDCVGLAPWRNSPPCRRV